MPHKAAHHSASGDVTVTRTVQHVRLTRAALNTITLTSAYEPLSSIMSVIKRHIFVCTNQRSPDDPRGSCSKLGSEAIHARFKQEAKRLDLKDVVRANKAGCLDHCAEGPSVVIYPEGVWYQVKSEADVTEIMERHVIKGEVVTRLIMPDHPAPTTLPPLKS